MEKVYFISYGACLDGFTIHAYSGFAKVIDTVEDGYNEEGYKSCLHDLGFSYGGNFIEEEKYKAKFAKTSDSSEDESDVLVLTEGESASNDGDRSTKNFPIRGKQVLR